jgi:hypothetical protein
MKHRNVLDSLTVAGGGFTVHERKLRAVLRNVLEAADDLVCAIEGVTDQFDTETKHLMDTCSLPAKALKSSASASKRARWTTPALPRILPVTSPTWALSRKAGPAGEQSHPTLGVAGRMGVKEAK